MEMCRFGELKELKEFISNHEKQEIKDLLLNPLENRISLLVLAANGHSKILELMLPMLTVNELNVRNSEGNTCLHWAAINNQLTTCEILLKYGLKESRNNSGFSAATLAEQRGFLPLANLILKSYDPESDTEDSAIVDEMIKEL
jgi:uncharacterized protein